VASVTIMVEMFWSAYDFNQCLSSWASKAPTDIYLRDMLYRTSCSNKLPVASVSPWCQGEDLLCFADNTSTSSSDVKCEAGYYCASMSQQKECRCRECEAGFYCPAGSSKSTGAGECEAGYYCPAGSFTKEGAGKCDVGYYCPAGSASSQGSGRCDGGYYCPTGSSTKEGLGLIEELLTAC